ncbi:hypothetical protein NUW58_g3723 [Xylaria curta]|uniref:Uncharacterized protein n=1 Tax=Xylaria curta TaxID=42375 RepID=A0ACC1P9L2_9PEZI|nr:hypothetical protein NUW58_g3723 [Xylaria curta]
MPGSINSTQTVYGGYVMRSCLRYLGARGHLTDQEHYTEERRPTQVIITQLIHPLRGLAVRKPRSLILLSSRSFKAVLKFALPLISIGLLEILWQMSKTSGLRDASDISSNSVRYSTSLVAATIAIIFNNLDFSIKTVTPYSRLRFVDSSPQSLTCNLLGRIPVSALYRSLRDTNLGAAFSSLASIIASFLTIISSGLWVVEPIELSAGVQSWTGNTWDLTWTNSSIYDDGAGFLLNRIQRNGSSTPKGIWKDLVLPEILQTTLVDEKTDGQFNLSDDGVKNKTRVSLTVAALRPQLECNSIPQGKIKLINEDVGTIIDTTHNLPASCHWSPGGNVDAWFVIDWDIGWDNGWGAGFYDLHMSPYQGSLQQNEMSKHEKNPNGCPSVVVLFGYIDKGDTSAQNMSVLVCSQKIQQVQTRLILKPDRSGLLGPDDFVSDPEPIESTSEYLRDEEGADTFNYRVQNRVDFRLRDIDDNNLSSLLGPGHIDDLVHAANNAYNAYMVQVINKPIFRRVEAHPFHLPKQQLFGNVTTTTSRLSIDCTSKIVLQVILAVVIGLGILAFCLIDTESTLPRDPLSIASVMALLAGSRLCSWRYMPADAEWMDTPQFEKVFRGMSFSLGWWKMSADTGDQRDATDLRFGIDVGKADKLGYR